MRRRSVGRVEQREVLLSSISGGASAYRRASQRRQQTREFAGDTNALGRRVLVSLARSLRCDRLRGLATTPCHCPPEAEMREAAISTTSRKFVPILSRSWRFLQQALVNGPARGYSPCYPSYDQRARGRDHPAVRAAVVEAAEHVPHQLADRGRRAVQAADPAVTVFAPLSGAPGCDTVQRCDTRGVLVSCCARAR